MTKCLPTADLNGNIMKTSKRGIDLIKKFEGISLKAYKDVVGVVTIGYGHTKDVTEGMRITEAQADEYLKEDLLDAEQTVTRYIKRKLSQNQFDALVSFVYNLGSGNFLKSTLLKKIRINPNDTSIAMEFGKWIHANGKVLNGLIRRRKMESDLYFTQEDDKDE